MEKFIKPVIIWANGNSNSANLFNIISISDNLIDEANFCYQLLNQNTLNNQINNILLSQGSLSLNQDEYNTWDGSNEWIINWATEKLNLEII
jgi:hypothetical protein